MEEKRITFIDGSSEQETTAVETFLDSLSPEEHERALSDEFDYLDEE